MKTVIVTAEAVAKLILKHTQTQCVRDSTRAVCTERRRVGSNMRVCDRACIRQCEDGCVRELGQQ